MSRPRKTDTHLPKYVYKRHGAYYFDKDGRWIRLGSELSEALAEYGRQFTQPSTGMPALIDQAMPSITAKVAKNTRLQYMQIGHHLKRKFQDFSPEQVQQRHVAKMKLDLQATPNQANHYLTVLRLVFSYALDAQLIDNNPATGIKPYPVAKRDRLISMAEFQAIHAQADPILRCIMDLLYLTGQRIADVLKIREDDIGEAGIYFRQQKTGTRLLVKWNPDLQAAVDRARALQGRVRALVLLPGRGGRPMHYGTASRRWNAACVLANVKDADLRDLRAMSGTDAEAQGLDPTALLGHKSRAMTERYLRDKKTPNVSGPSFGQVKILDRKSK